MKKLLIALVLGLLLVAALATVASADNGPHGNFSATTDACAGCHRAHTAQGIDFLLVDADIYQLCTGCHNGTGAATDVVNGYYHASGTQGDPGQCLFGGGFDFTLCTHSPNGQNQYTNPGPAAPEAVTSNHEVKTGTTLGTVWGSGNIDNSLAGNTGGTMAATNALECTSCHNPHGKGGQTVVAGVATGPAASYRILRFNPTGSNGFEATTGPSNGYFTGAVVAGATGGVQVADVLANKYWYTPNTDATVDPSVRAFRARLPGGATAYVGYINGVNDWAGRVYVYQRPAYTVDGIQYTCPDATGQPVVGNVSCANGTAGTIWDNATPAQKLGQWCALCHDRYLSNGGRSVDSGDTVYKFRHSSQGSLACVMCHGAHGTAAVMTTTLAQGATLNSGSSDLLKYDNRSICADCHGSDVGYYSTPLVYRP